MSLIQKMDKILQNFYRSLLARLDEKVSNYDHRIPNNMRNLKKYIRKGDVLLVEGDSEISRIIKLFSTSHWSHIAFYVADELIKKGSPLRETLLDQYGEGARYMLIEAFASRGVIASPVTKYRDFNIRICRPFAISKSDMQEVTDLVIADLGKHYDQRNIVDIALMLMPKWLNPFRKRNMRACLGNCNDFEVICSGMIARAFQNVGYPIAPVLPASESGNVKSPYGDRLVMRHFTQILPRDFDLSPNFEIIKFNIIESGKFDYRSLPWFDLNIRNLKSSGQETRTKETGEQHEI